MWATRRATSATSCRSTWRMPEGYDKVDAAGRRRRCRSRVAPVTIPGHERRFHRAEGAASLSAARGQRHDAARRQHALRFAADQGGAPVCDRMGALVGLHLVEGHGPQFQRDNCARHGGRAGGGTKGTSSSGPMGHDRAQTFYSSFIWELPFFRNSGGFTRPSWAAGRSPTS